MKNTTFRAHPVYIYKMLKRFVFVLIAPVIKGAVQYILYGRIYGITLPTVVALAILLALSVWRLLSFKIELDDGFLTIKDGIFIRKRAIIPRKNISSITVTRHFLLDVIKAATVSVNTESGVYGKKDFTFKLSVFDAGRFENIIYGNKTNVEMRFSAGKIAILSATASSALTGLIVGAPVVNRLGKFLGVGAARVLSDISTLSKGVKLYFPPAVNALTILFIVIYGISFLVSLARNMFFRINIGKEKMEIRSGLYYKRKRVFSIFAVKDICIDQTPLMRLFGTHTMRIGIGGYGSKNGEKSTVVPAMNKQSIKNGFSPLFPALVNEYDFVTPENSVITRRRFLRLPNLYAITVLAANALLIILFPSFERFFLFAALVLSALISYYGYISLINHKTCGIAVGEMVVAKGLVGFTVRELYVDSRQIGLITVKRSPADKRHGTCKATVSVRSESSDRAKVKMIPYLPFTKKIEKTYGIKP